MTVERLTAILIKSTLLGVWLTCITACSSLPSQDIATTALKKILPMSFSVEEIHSVKGISGLCEVVVVAAGQPMVFYMDKKGAYIITGNVVNADTKQNLTIEALQHFQNKKK